MTMRRLFAAAGTALLLSACATTAPQETAEGGLVADHDVIVMRHGVRPPTKDPALPPGYAADPWPAVFAALPAWLAEDAWLYLESPADAGIQPGAGFAMHREGRTRESRHALYRRVTLAGVPSDPGVPPE